MIKLFDFKKFVKILFNNIVQYCSTISIVHRRCMFGTKRISSFGVHYSATLFDNSPNYSFQRFILSLYVMFYWFIFFVCIFYILFTIDM